MKTILQIAFKYLKYLVLNKRKLDYNKESVSPPPLPHTINGYQNHLFIYELLFLYISYKQKPTKCKVGSKPHPTSRRFLSKVGPTGSNSYWTAQC